MLNNTIFTALFLLLAFTGSAQVYDLVMKDHKEKAKEMFFHLLDEVSDKLSDTTLTPEQQRNLFNPIVDYTKKEQSKYKEIRTAYLKQTPSPPEVLSSIRFHHLEDSSFTKILSDPKFIDLTLFQCYRPVEIAGIINNIIQPSIYQSSGISTREASIAYTFGRQAFARNLQDDTWQIWLANRAYVMRFVLDLNGMHMSKLEYSLPNTPSYLKIQLPFISHKQANELDKLYQEMDQIRWDTYSTDLLQNMLPEVWQDSINQGLRSFCAKNQQRFLGVRKEVLQGLKKGFKLDTLWEELRDLSATEQQRLQQALQLNIIQPDEAAYQLFSFTNGIAPFNEDINEIGKNAMAGFRHYCLSKNDEQTWQIQSKGYTIAFEYCWNIKTGTFSNLKIFKQKDGISPL